MNYLEIIEHEGQRYYAVEQNELGSPCHGCVCETSDNLCKALPACSHLTRDDHQNVIWVKEENLAG